MTCVPSATYFVVVECTICRNFGGNVLALAFRHFQNGGQHLLGVQLLGSLDRSSGLHREGIDGRQKYGRGRDEKEEGRDAGHGERLIWYEMLFRRIIWIVSIEA